MRFEMYITEDAESVRQYKKALFDLKVALGELDFYKGEKKPEDAEAIKAFKMAGISIKEKIVSLKEKVLKLAGDLGESVDKTEGLKDVLDQIPDKDSKEFEGLEKRKASLGA
jgi:hypothetical protein